MPASGRDRDARAPLTSVSARRVSPANTGRRKVMLPNPRFATVVPRVVSVTVSPVTSPSVKRLLTIGCPNSVDLANSASRCNGCGFIVRHVNQTLSASVTVRRITCWITSPTSSSSNHFPETGRSIDSSLTPPGSHRAHDVVAGGHGALPALRGEQTPDQLGPELIRGHDRVDDDVTRHAQ